MTTEKKGLRLLEVDNFFRDSVAEGKEVFFMFLLGEWFQHLSGTGKRCNTCSTAYEVSSS
jgi:hypothetical protein